jgi:hypothetical protein
LDHFDRPRKNTAQVTQRYQYQRPHVVDVPSALQIVTDAQSIAGVRERPGGRVRTSLKGTRGGEELRLRLGDLIAK